MLGYMVNCGRYRCNIRVIIIKRMSCIETLLGKKKKKKMQKKEQQLNRVKKIIYTLFEPFGAYNVSLNIPFCFSVISKYKLKHKTKVSQTTILGSFRLMVIDVRVCQLLDKVTCSFLTRKS